ncbi:hypothetical protein AA313_de0204753 [Arthrobotrys entomopaga]|nr:hypothetical protein AA313_de0204753 [Arthrobotrys entomopaga]
MIRNRIYNASRGRLYPLRRPTCHALASGIPILGTSRLRSGARSFSEFLHGSNTRHLKDKTDFTFYLGATLMKAIRRHDPNTNECSRFILFFVTPDKAGLVSDHGFLRSIVREAVGSSGVGISSVDIVAAVMDGYPQFGPIKGIGKGWNAFVTDRRFEIFSSVGEAYHEHPCTKEQMSTPISQSSANMDFTPGELQLQFQTLVFDNLKKPLKKRSFTPLRVKWKLANTLFQTGKATTLVRHFYKFGYIKEAKEYGITKAVSEDLRDVTIRMHDALKFNASVHRPLEPITRPRKISRAFGNIIQELTMRYEGVDSTIHASEELEPAIEEFLASHPEYQPGKQDSFPLDIYARLTEYPFNPKLGITKRPSMPGTRILKVLSGGGGWGANAGILALDPENMPEFKLAEEGQPPENRHWIQFYVRREGERISNEAPLGRFFFNILGKNQVGEVGSSEFLQTGETVVDAVPAEAASTESEPAESVSTESTHPESASMESAPTESVLTESTTVESTPVEIVSPESVSTKSVPTESISPERVPTEIPPIEHTTPKLPGFLSIGSETEFWIDGIKLDVRGSQIILDLVAEVYRINNRTVFRETMNLDKLHEMETKPKAEGKFDILRYKWDKNSGGFREARSRLRPLAGFRPKPKVESRSTLQVESKSRDHRNAEDKESASFAVDPEIIEIYRASGAVSTSTSQRKSWREQQKDVVNPRTEHSTDAEALLYEMRTKQGGK